MSTTNVINNINFMSQGRFDELSSTSDNEIYAVEDDTSLIFNKLLKIQTKVFEGALWLRIFHHYSNNGANYFSTTNVKYNINDNIYSILQFIPQLKYDQTKYEFLLEYPDVDTTKYNRWTQTSNPVTTSDSVTGYTAIHVDWSLNFGGLALSTSTANTFIDGNIGSGNWWYAIGDYANFDSTGGFPGPDGTAVQKADLWLRIG